jgi:hypothetical protein
MAYQSTGTSMVYKFELVADDYIAASLSSNTTTPRHSRIPAIRIAARTAILDSAPARSRGLISSRNRLGRSVIDDNARVLLSDMAKDLCKCPEAIP